MSTPSRSGSHHLTPYDKDYPPCEQTRVSFRVYSYSLSPDDISAILDLKPDRSAKKGAVIRNEKSGVERTPRVTSWIISSEGKIESKDLRDHLDFILSLLESRQGPLKQLQQHDDVTMNVLCVWWSAEGGGGPVLWPAQMSQLANLDLECAFDFQYYGPDRK